MVLAQFVRKVWHRNNSSLEETENTIKIFLDEIILSLGRQESSTIQGFGTFKLKNLRKNYRRPKFVRPIAPFLKFTHTAIDKVRELIDEEFKKTSEFSYSTGARLAPKD